MTHPLPDVRDVRLPPLQMAAADINDDDLRVVTEVLRSGRLALGGWAGAFEQAVALDARAVPASLRALGRHFLELHGLRL